MKIGWIDAKGMDVAQPIWLSGCPTKGNFSAKNAVFDYHGFKQNPRYAL